MESFSPKIPGPVPYEINSRRTSLEALPEAGVVSLSRSPCEEGLHGREGGS